MSAWPRPYLRVVFWLRLVKEADLPNAPKVLQNASSDDLAQLGFTQSSEEPVSKLTATV